MVVTSNIKTKLRDICNMKFELVCYIKMQSCLNNNIHFAPIMLSSEEQIINMTLTLELLISNIMIKCKS